MCVVYLVNRGCTMKKNNGRAVIVNAKQEVLYSIPLQEIESVVVCSEAQITTTVIYALLEQQVQISYTDYTGKIIGTLGDDRRSLQRLLMQQRCFEDPACQLELVRDIIRQKMKNQQELLRLYANRKKSAALKEIMGDIGKYREALSRHNDIEELRGLEGMASRCYFSGFPYMLRQEIWEWQGRNRRPPQDPVNSLLSYGYAFLEREVRMGIAGARLDARIGFLHSNDGRKDSLVFDLMELFRHSVIDRFVLKLLNYSAYAPLDFYKENGACWLSPIPRKKWLGRYEEYMTEPLQGIGGKCWREFIRAKIEDFAERAWQLKILT